MPSHSGFLADILERPDDDTPRLIYADWLDDHGDAERAAFIRWQIEAAQLPEGDPRACDLASRAEGILAAHEQEWVGEWGERLVDWTFRRGFLSDVTLLPAVFTESAQDLFARFPLRRFRFVAANGQEIHTDAIQPLVASPHFGRVESLDASGVNTRTWIEQLTAATHVSALRELDLRDELGVLYAAHGEELAQFCAAGHLQSLTTLDLSCEPNADNQFDRPIAASFANASFARNLRELTLDGANVTDDGLLRLAQDPTFARLERLRLADARNLSPQLATLLLDSSQLTDLTELCIGWECSLTALAAAPRLRQLRQLDLWLGNNLVLSPQQWSAFAHALDGGNLTHLRLAYAILGEESVAVLLSVPGLRNLRELAIWGGDGVGDRVLEFVSANPLGLTSLELTRTGVSASGVRALAASPRLAELASLRLWWDEVWPPAQRELLDSAFLSPRLSRLDLAGWHLRDDGLELLARNPRLSGLTHLNLRSCHLEVAGMFALLEAPHLTRLTSLNLGSAPDEVLDVLGESTGLPRLREVIVHPRVRPDTLALLRHRLGPRLIVDPHL